MSEPTMKKLHRLVELDTTSDRLFRFPARGRPEERCLRQWRFLLPRPLSGGRPLGVPDAGNLALKHTADPFTPFFRPSQLLVVKSAKMAVPAATPFQSSEENRMRTTVIGLVVMGLLAMVGCHSQTGSALAGKTSVTAADLGKLGFAIAGYEDSFKKGPASAADLKPFMESTLQDRAALQRVTDGDVVVLWGASMKAMKAGPAATIIAYARDVPTAGGLVLFGSGEVRTLTAAVFASTPQAARP
jgi:hypothetical protein